jgi:hypothetical protein
MKIGDIKLQWKSHMSLDDEHITVYASDDNRIGVCVHVITSDGRYGRSYRHYRIDDKVYKNEKKFINDLKKIKYGY